MSQFKLIVVALLAVVLAGCQKSNSINSPYNNVYTYSPKYVTKTENGFVPSRTRNSRGGKRYFLEFRARHALSYGHASVVLGQLDSRGRVPTDSKGNLIKGKTEVAGLHPSSTSPTLYSVGHAVPIKAETGWSDGDSEEAYVTAKYTIKLTESQFKRVTAKVRARKERHKLWHAVTASCVTFIRGVADDIGLQTPQTPHLPTNFVKKLKALNGSNPRI